MLRVFRPEDVESNWIQDLALMAMSLPPGHGSSLLGRGIFLDVAYVRTRHFHGRLMPPHSRMGWHEGHPIHKDADEPTCRAAESKHVQAAATSRRLCGGTKWGFHADGCNNIRLVLPSLTRNLCLTSQSVCILEKRDEARTRKKRCRILI